MNGWILLPVFLPAIAGILLLASSFREHLKNPEKGQRTDKIQPDKDDLRKLHIFAGGVLIVSAVLAVLAAVSGEHSVTLFYLMENVPIYFRIDNISRIFAVTTSIVWVLAGFYAFVYMEHEGEEKRFFGFYLLVYGVLMALDFAGNLVTLYFFYELMTLTSMPMVLHNGSREAIMAALKYLFYSMCGAYLGLFGIFFLYRYCDTLTFTPGGNLDLSLVQGHETILLIAVFCMLVGFGAKAGMLPLHAWLPAAHPVAPSPASAVLSGIIVKAGVLAAIRTVYYVVGADFLRGTWVQTAWSVLTLLTVFMGSMLAFREPVFKKRLAYSTVSQVSYILFGLAMMEPAAMTGALLHTVFHAFIKCGLFLTAGVFIFKCHKTRVSELTGIGKEMPVTLWCYTFSSLALIGIPPASGFVSKWYLAQGALDANVGVFRYLGPAVLLVSALLTAGYLLPVTMKGFFPGKEAARIQTGTDVQAAKSAAQAGTDKEAGRMPQAKKAEPPMGMLVPLMILAGLSILLGVLPNPLIDFISRTVSGLM